MIRRIREADRAAALSLLLSTGNFTKAEVDIAAELLAIVAAQPDQRDYHAFVAERVIHGATRLGGLLIIGLVAATAGTWHLYWIAAHPHFHGSGVAQDLDLWATSMVREHGGYWLLAETSGQPSYKRARAFYQKQGYIVLTKIADYYKPADDLIIFGKRV